MIPLFKVFMSDSVSSSVTKTLESGYVGQGPRVEEFEVALKDLLGLPSVPLATLSGTQALDLAYHLVGVGLNTSVVTTPMTCLATNIPLLHRGTQIIWADVSPYTGLIDPVDVRRKVREDTVAIVAVDWAGRPCDYEALRSIGIPVIQDGAHSILAPTADGNCGHYRMWSFQAIKHLTCGDGGALMVPEEEYERADRIRWYGLNRREGAHFRCYQDVKEPGYKAGMNDVAASIGLANIGFTRLLVDQHRKNARYLSMRLNRVFYEDSSYWVYPILSERRTELLTDLMHCGISVSEVHSRNDKKSCFHSAIGGLLPGLDEFSRRQANIPCGWWLNPDQLNFIANVAGEYL